MSEEQLCALDPVFEPIVRRCGACAIPLRRQDPYEALVSAVAGQQLHAKAAEAILSRLVALYPESAFPPPERLLATEPALLRACGFSTAKIVAIHQIAAGAISGVVPTQHAAQQLDDETLIRQLTTLRGVGRWTVEMLLIFTLGRSDVLPVDDFAVREGWRVLNGLDRQPKPRELALRGQRWAPFRSTAAWYLWRAADEAKQLRSLKA